MVIDKTLPNSWPAGKMPSAQTNQCTPYLEWHMPKTLKTKAIQMIYSGGSYMGNGPDTLRSWAPLRPGTGRIGR